MNRLLCRRAGRSCRRRRARARRRSCWRPPFTIAFARARCARRSRRRTAARARDRNARRPGPGWRASSSTPASEAKISCPSRVRISSTVFSLSGVTATISTGKRSGAWPDPSRRALSGRRPSSTARPIVVRIAPRRARPSRRRSRMRRRRRPPLGLTGIRLIVGIAEQPRDADRNRLAIDRRGRRDLLECGRRSARRCGRRAPSPPCSPASRRAPSRRRRLQQRRQFEPHFIAQLGVDIAQGIVEQQDLRVGDERARERRALLLPVGEFARRMAQHMADLQQRCDLLDLRLDRGGRARRAPSARSRYCHRPTYAETARNSGTPCRRRASPARASVTSRPSSTIVPASGSSTPAIRRSSTVLPAPDGPKMQTISPSSADRASAVEDLAGLERLAAILEFDLRHDQPFTAPSDRPSTR